MSIADKITRLQTAKTNIAAAITNKGGTVSQGDGFEDFVADIGTIPTGQQPTGTIKIDENYSQVDVTNYATANIIAPVRIAKLPHTDNHQKWHFPADEWSITTPVVADMNIDLIEIEDNEQVVYYLHDLTNTNNSWCRLRLYTSIANGALVDYGYCNNGVYTPIVEPEIVGGTSGTYWKIWFNDIGYDRIVIRVRNNGSAWLKQVNLYAWESDGVHTGAYPIAAQPVLMRKGCLPYATNASVSGNVTIEYDNIKNLGASLTNTLITALYATCYCLQYWRHDGWTSGSLTTNSFNLSLSGCYLLCDADLDLSYFVGQKSTSFAMGTCAILAGEVDCTGWKLDNITSLSNAFNGCFNIIVKGTETWTGGNNITNWSGVFNSLYNQKEIDLSGVTMTNKVTTFASLFSSCYNLKKVVLPDLDLTNVTTIASMFNYCCVLNNIIHGTITLQNPTKNLIMTSIFNYCYSLTGTDFLKGLDLSMAYTTANVTNLSGLFTNCYSLKSTDDLDFTGTVWPMPPAPAALSSSWSVYSGCVSMTKMDISFLDNTAMSNETANYMMASALSTCVNVVDFYPPQHIRPLSSAAGINYSSFTKLSHDSLVRIINNLNTVTSTARLQLGAINLSKLTAEEIAVGTNKGWTIN